MDATLILIDSDAELARAQTLITTLMASEDPADSPRLEAQARLVAAYERSRWPRRVPTPAAVLGYLLDQHGLSRADLVPLLGTTSRVSEILAGKKGFSMRMVQRLRARFGVSADVLIPDAGAAAPGPRSGGNPRIPPFF